MAKINRGSSNVVKGKSILSRKPQSSTFQAKTTDKKRSCRPMTSNEKLKAIELHQQGLSQREISIKLDIPKSTLFDIIKNKNTLLTRSVPANGTKFYSNNKRTRSHSWRSCQRGRISKIHGIPGKLGLVTKFLKQSWGKKKNYTVNILNLYLTSQTQNWKKIIYV